MALLLSFLCEGQKDERTKRRKDEKKEGRKDKMCVKHKVKKPGFCGLKQITKPCDVIKRNIIEPELFSVGRFNIINAE